LTALSYLERDLRRGWHTPGDQAPVRFSRHAIERFGERARPALPLEEVERQLAQMLRTSVISFEPPEWLSDPGREAWGYLLIAEYVMPLYRHGDELDAATLLAPNTLGPEKRAARNELKAKRRSSRSAHRRVQGRDLDGGRRERGPDASEWTDGAA
jgi:hypothetical protein